MLSGIESIEGDIRADVNGWISHLIMAAFFRTKEGIETIDTENRRWALQERLCRRQLCGECGECVATQVPVWCVVRGCVVKL